MDLRAAGRRQAEVGHFETPTSEKYRILERPLSTRMSSLSRVRMPTACIRFFQSARMFVRAIGLFTQ